MSRPLRLGLLAAVLLAVAGVAAVVYRPEDDPTPGMEATTVDDPEFDYVIPAGTADRLAAGDDVEILPREIDASVGESIRITNDDDEAVLLGPWFVAPGETLTHRFASPGVYEGECQVHPSGQITLVVTA